MKEELIKLWKEYCQFLYELGYEKGASAYTMTGFMNWLITKNK